MLKESQYHWEGIETNDGLNENIELLTSYKIPELFIPYVKKIGLETKEDFEKFFHPDTNNLYDPYLLKDMDKAINRLQQAIENQEKILIYGDYDADGITSTTILKEAIESVGGDVFYYLPNRFKDGYGPNIRVYKEFIEFGISLIVTVDNGVSGHEAISFAKEQGVDVIVTDHHELPEVLPEAYAIVHPRHPEGDYPFGELAGAGVSFKVACALSGEISPDLLELAAIGTVADLVPLVDENRVIVQLGLEQMKYTQRVGLISLLKVSGLSFDEMTEEAIAFQIAPRLNALGRMGDASVGVELLGTFHEEEADKLSQEVNNTNELRKDEVKKATALAFEKVKDEAISFVADESFHEGIIGIVAGKLKQARNRPAFVLTINKETGMAKGSARGIEAFDLFKNLQKISDIFESFGGHKMAAGFTLKVENLSVFKEKMITFFIEETKGKDLRETATTDFMLTSTKEVTKELVDTLQRFGPFGTKHPKPHFLLEDITLKEAKRIGAEFDHLKFTIQKDGPEISAIAFQKGPEISELTSGGTVNVLVDASINNWNGIQQVQFQLLDYEVLGLQLFDGRKDKRKAFINETNQYLVWDKRVIKSLHLPEEQVVFYETKSKDSPKETFVMVDCPTNLTKLKEFVEENQVTRLIIVAYSFHNAFLNGLPSRDVFTKVYKFLMSKKDLDVRYKSQEIAKFLGISHNWFIFIVEVFLEVNFVKIEDGVLNPVPHPKPQPLEETKTYQNWQKEMNVEKFLLYSSLPDISSWLMNKEETT